MVLYELGAAGPDFINHGKHLPDYVKIIQLGHACVMMCCTISAFIISIHLFFFSEKSVLGEFQITITWRGLLVLEGVR
jgi:hypothetical protein